MRIGRRTRLRGRIYSEVEGNIEKADANFRRAIELRPQNDDILEMYVNLHIQSYAVPETSRSTRWLNSGKNERV